MPIHPPQADAVNQQIRGQPSDQAEGQLLTFGEEAHKGNGGFENAQRKHEVPKFHPEYRVCLTQHLGRTKRTSSFGHSRRRKNETGDYQITADKSLSSVCRGGISVRYYLTLVGTEHGFVSTTLAKLPPPRQQLMIRGEHYFVRHLEKAGGWL